MNRIEKIKELKKYIQGLSQEKTHYKDGTTYSDIVIDGKNSPLEIFTSSFDAFKLALSAFSFELFLNASDKVLSNSFAPRWLENKEKTIIIKNFLNIFIKFHFF